MNAETGEIYWSYIIGHDGPPEHVGEYDVISSPAVVGERVYIGSGDSWTYPEGDSHVYCFNAFTGNLIWKYPTNDSVYSSPAVYCGKVYVGSYDENVYCLDASTGDLIWNKELNGTVWCSPTVDNGKVYVGNRERIIPRSDSIFYCLDANTGDLIWRYPAIDSGDEIGSIMSSPALAYGNVYIGTEEPDGSVYCLDADTGALKWTYETGGDIHHSSPAVAAGMVYIGSWATDIGVGEPGYLHCLNAHTGDRIWEYPDAPNGYHSSSPVIAYGMVFTAADNIIYAFDSTMFIIPEPTAMVTTILMFSALASVYFIKKTKLRSK